MPDIETWKEALGIVAKALNEVKGAAGPNYNYMVIGSSAYSLYGVTYEDQANNPGDIDITSSNPVATAEAIMNLNKIPGLKVTELPESNWADRKFVLTMQNGKTVELDFTHMDDFGMAATQATSRNNVPVTSVIDTLLSCYTRPERREKELIAFKDLIRNNADYLRQNLSLLPKHNPHFSNAVRVMLDIFNNPQSAANQQLVDSTVFKVLISNNPTAKEKSPPMSLLERSVQGSPFTPTRSTTSGVTSVLSSLPPQQRSSVPSSQSSQPQARQNQEIPESRKMSAEERQKMRLKRLADAEAQLKAKKNPSNAGNTQEVTRREGSKENESPADTPPPISPRSRY